MSKWTTKEEIDNAIRERDTELIVSALRHPDTPQAVREHLADFVAAFLNGKAKFPHRRPKRRGLQNERSRIAEQVYEARVRATLASGRLKPSKLSSVIQDVAAKRRISPTTLWKCWSEFDLCGYELWREEMVDDAARFAADEARWESAIESLKDEWGPGREFTDEEIEAAVKELDECGRDYDD
jgi:hypothetical protein